MAALALSPVYSFPWVNSLGHIPTGWSIRRPSQGAGVAGDVSS